MAPGRGRGRFGQKHFSSNSKRGRSPWPYARSHFQERTGLPPIADEHISAPPESEVKQPDAPTPPSVMMSTSPMKSSFEEPIDIDGILQFTDMVYQRISSWCNKAEVRIDDTLLKYVVVIVCSARIACVRWMLHLGISEESKRLIDATKFVKLPSPLVQMVNAIGSFQLANGCCVAPQSVQETWTESIQLLLAHGGRDQDHLLDIAWLAEYNDRASRSPLSGCTFINANFEHPEGREEMVISYSDVQGRLVPFSPQASPQPTAELGALYRFHQNFGWSPESLLRPNHEGKAFDPSVLFNKLLHAQEK